MKKQLITLAFMLSVAASAFAFEREIDGLWYDLVSDTKEATLIKYKNDIKYSGDIVIPETVEFRGATYRVTCVGNEAFRDCGDLTSVIIPGSVTTLEDFAVGYCVGLTSLTLQEGLKSLGRYAFCGCEKLTSVTIPGSVTNIGYCAFQYCHAMTSLTLQDGMTGIGQQAFQSCTALTSVTIPSSVSSIGMDAFSFCESLTSVTIRDGVKSIEGGAFAWCRSLISVTIPGSVESIGGSAFAGCESLESVIIQNGVKNIGDGAFSDCWSLTSVTIPNSVTSIESSAFHGCSSLGSIKIPNGIKSIEDYTFRYCSSLTTIKIPDSVTSIGRSAFLGCSKMETINIGSGVKTIYQQAFADCPKLTTVHCYAEKVPSMKDWAGNNCTTAFDGSDIGKATLYVPKVSINAYKAVEPWKKFKSILALSAKCATPTITFEDGNLEFNCETENVEYVFDVTAGVAKKENSNKYSLTGIYTVSVYAKRAGYDDSDEATLEFTLEGSCDVNKDGIVDVADIATIIDKMAGK